MECTKELDDLSKAEMRAALAWTLKQVVSFYDCDICPVKPMITPCMNCQGVMLDFAVKEGRKKYGQVEDSANA